ncbi:MAG: aspartate aminotransferase family protein [Planctomycetes bacterium]|nr:aspartate aminotransferase family protein [Planctomycetota bacterium]
MDTDDYPQLKTSVPGPRSLSLARDLKASECRGITFTSPEFPVFWESARDAMVWDADGNRFLDLTAGFGVASLGHGHPAVLAALKEQSSRLLHAMGDVHPAAVKVELARLLAEVTPGDLGRAVFGSSGSEAVETALKTAVLATGRPHLLAFEGAYHGLTYGALAATHRADFRQPFEKQIGLSVRHLPFPNPYRPPGGVDAASCGRFCLDRVGEALRADPQVGAILVEPIQGRGGEIVPPDDFLPGLRGLADQHGVLLIADEVYTGFCRSGRWFAVEHWGVVPDLLCLGKAMSNGFPISACVGRPQVMDAWPESTGEAIHTSTFLGHPAGCAMAVSAIREMMRLGLDRMADAKGRFLMERLKPLLERHACVGEIRGRGLLIGIELVRDRARREPDPQAAWRVVAAALRRGLILLSGGPGRNVLSLTPPITITERQLEFAARTLDECLALIGSSKAAGAEAPR